MSDREPLKTMPDAERLMNLSAALNDFHAEWSSAPVFVEHRDLKRRLVSSLAWALAGMDLLFAEIEITSKTTGAVIITAFAQGIVIRIEGQHDLHEPPSAEIAGWGGITRIRIDRPDDLASDLMYPGPSGMTFEIQHESLGALTIGANRSSQMRAAEFYPALVSSL